MATALMERQTETLAPEAMPSAIWTINELLGRIEAQ